MFSSNDSLIHLYENVSPQPQAREEQDSFNDELNEIYFSRYQRQYPQQQEDSTDNNNNNNNTKEQNLYDMEDSSLLLGYSFSQICEYEEGERETAKS